MSMTPRASLDGADDPTAGKNKDPLLHRLLDKNYRIQATPHKPMTHGTSPKKWKVTGTAKESDRARGEKAPAWQDSPMSSPEMAVPKLRSEAFMSPLKAAYRGRPAAAAGAPRTPGVSVQTPAAGRKTKDVLGTESDRDNNKTQQRKDRDEITWESDSDKEFDDIYGGMSPPKTIQFALPPSRLLQTPGVYTSTAEARRWKC